MQSNKDDLDSTKCTANDHHVKGVDGYCIHCGKKVDPLFKKLYDYEKF